MNVAQRLQAEYDECNEMINDPETLSGDRTAALQRAVELRAPLKAATDADVASLFDAVGPSLFEG